MNSPAGQLAQEFFYKPMDRFGVRELSRLTKLDTKTVMKYLANLVHEGIVVKHKPKGGFVFFEANRLSSRYRFEKSYSLVRRVLFSGLIEFIEQEVNPKSIILFGSAKKGTYHEKSDIDLFVQSTQRRLELSRFERKIGHKINILFEENLQNLTPGLLQNIYNGELLSGNLEVA